MSQSIHVLLVDDDEGVRDMLVHVLREAGYQVDAVGSAATASSNMKGRKYDLVITDAKLLDGTGIAIADAARARGMAAVILTGYAAETRPGGPQHEYLFKPIRPDELVRAVGRHVAHSRRA
jgi:DNA-binding NtrC family response regulator